MIAIDTESVLAVVYAQSALYYHLHGGERASVLNRDHKKALEECVKNSFATMTVRICSYLDNVTLGEDGMLTCEFKPRYLEMVSDKRLRIALESALSHYTLHMVALGYDREMSDHFGRQYASVMEGVESWLEGWGGTVRLTEHYV